MASRPIWRGHLRLALVHDRHGVLALRPTVQPPIAQGQHSVFLAPGTSYALQLGLAVRPCGRGHWPCPSALASSSHRHTTAAAGSMADFRVFLSAVSSEFGAARVRSAG